MRFKLFAGVVIGSLFTSSVYAAPENDPVHEAVAREFPGLKAVVSDNKTVNGIPVTWFTIESGGASALAAVTDKGDFLVAGEPHDPNKLPGPVDKRYQELFGEKAQSADRYLVTNYQITIDVGGRHTNVSFDAVGRLKVITPDSDVAAEPNGAEEQDVINKDTETTKRMKSMADRFYGEGNTVEHIYHDPEAEYFWRVELTAKDGHHWVVVTDGNDVYSRREKIGEHQVPQAVIDAAGDIFKGSKIVATYRRIYEYYQFDVHTSSDDTLTLKIGTNGDVLGVKSAKSEEDMETIHTAQHPK